MSIVNNCNECKQVTLPACPDYIQFNMGMDATVGWFARVYDKFDNVWQIECPPIQNINSFDPVFVPTTDLPEGLFNENAGTFYIEFYQEPTYCAPYDIYDGGHHYTCVAMTFFKSYGYPVEAVVNCLGS